MNHTIVKAHSPGPITTIWAAAETDIEERGGVIIFQVIMEGGGRKTVRLPKSQIEIWENDGLYHVNMPRWLYFDRGLDSAACVPIVGSRPFIECFRAGEWL